MDITNNVSTILIQNDDTQFSFSKYWNFVPCNKSNTYYIINNFTRAAITDYNSSITLNKFTGVGTQWIIYSDPCGFCRIMDSSNGLAITRNAQAGFSLTPFQTDPQHLFLFEEYVGTQMCFSVHLHLIATVFFVDSCVFDPACIYQIVDATNNFVVHHGNTGGAQLHYDFMTSVLDEWLWRFIPISGTPSVYLMNSIPSNMVADATTCGALNLTVAVWGIYTACTQGHHQWWKIDSYFGYCKITNFYNNQSWSLGSNNEIQLSWFVRDADHVFKIFGK